MHILDNPIWNALTTRQQSHSVGGNLARRFDSSIGPLAGLWEQSEEAYAELAQTLNPGERAALFLTDPPRIPDNWQILTEGELIQMICPEVPALPAGNHPPLETLTPEEIPAMLDLVQLTEPGPFRPRTIELGGYIGIRMEGRLAAMAGYRLAPPGFREISAVCTHPDFRGRGYAQLLVASLARRIHTLGETPFLTSYAQNHNAIRVYQNIGFQLRHSLHLAIITPATPFT